MHTRTVAAVFVAGSLTLSGCSRSDLDRCIDSQMAAWKQQHEEYEKSAKEDTPSPQAAAQYTQQYNEGVNSGGYLPVDPSLLPAFTIGDSRTKEEAEAQANLQCGKIYAKRN